MACPGRSLEESEEASGHFTAPSIDTDRRAWAILFLLMFSYVISFIDRNILALMVEPVKLSLGLSDVQISLLQGLSFALFFCLVGLPIGWMVDRYARKYIIAGGITIWSLAASSCGLATNFTQLALGRFGVGAGEAALSPSAYSMIADMFPRRRLSLAINIFVAGSTLGSALALVVGGIAISAVVTLGGIRLPLLGHVEPWQLVYLLTGLPGLLVAPIYLFLREPARRVHADSHPKSISFGKHLFAQRRYHVSVFVGMALITVLAYAFGAWFPTYLIRVQHLDAGRVGLIVGGICAAGGVSGYLVSGMAADFLFARRMFDIHLRLPIWCCVGCIAAAIVGLGWRTDLRSALIAAALIYFFLPFSQTLTSHLQIVTPPHMRGRTSALYVFVFNLVGQALGPSMVAAFTQYLYRDPQSVGRSLALTFAVVGPLAIIALIPGKRSARELGMQ